MADSVNPAGPNVSGTPYDAQINAAALKYELRPALLAGLIRQESHFDPTLTSPAGAQGLAQLMPGTAKSLGVTEPYDATQSIDGGAKYLAQQLKSFGGNETLALAAYNAGPHNVEKYGGVPPFRETQEYVKIVEANAAAYSGGTVAHTTSAHTTTTPHTLEYGARGAEVVAAQRELGVRADGEFGPKTEHAVRAFQAKHGLAQDGIIGPLTRAALEKARETPEPAHPSQPPAHPQPAGTQTAMQTFQKTWEANATVNARTGATTYPQLSATLDQKNNTIALEFRDKTGAMQSATMNVGETSSGRYDAAHILPGNYQLGNFAWNPKGAETQGNGLTKSDIAYGSADIPINMRDGHDAVPVVLKGGRVSDGVYERLHGGGSGLARTGGPDAPFAPHQPLTGTYGCVRAENEDATVVARLVEKSGRPIGLTITRDTRSTSHEIQRSSDGGTTWRDMTGHTSISGKLHDSPGSEVVSLITRNGNPPETISFKPDQLGFTKAQIEQIAARDPEGRISIGIDRYNQPVVNAHADLARGQEHSRSSVGVER